MIIAFLREKKREILQHSDLETLKKVLLSEYLLGFLEFYSLKFNLNDQEIYMKDGGCIRKKKSDNYGFSVLYNEQEELNLGQQAFRIREIFAVFRNRFNFVMNFEGDGKTTSILKYLINPSETNFKAFL